MNHKLATFLAGLGAFLVVALLVFAMKYYTRPIPLNAGRAEERRKALAEVREASAKTLNTAEVVDPGKGFIRVRIDTAMEVTVKEYQNPASFRTNLVARADKLAQPPPKVEYE
jgi:hypothetical protein